MATMQPTEWLTEFLRPMAIKPPWADRCDQEFKKEPLLDVGCGDGALASELARRGAIVAGLDADPVMIAAARPRTEIKGTQLRFIEGQAERLPFDSAAFDCVVAATVLCFVRDAERAVAEMPRVIPSWASEITNLTPRKPRRASLRRNHVQKASASEGPISMPSTSRRPSLLTPPATITATETMPPKLLASTAVLVREAEAKLQLSRQPRPSPTLGGGPTTPGSGPQQPGAEPTPGPQPLSKPRRFFGSVEIDMVRPVKSFDAILNAVVMELQRTQGAKVKLTLEIEAEATGGFEARGYWASWRTRSRRRMLVAQVLAEGVQLQTKFSPRSP